jgi:hypothetical protein
MRLEGRFESVRGLDLVTPGELSYWVPLSSRGWEDARLPVDVVRYPIVEITYRCSSPDARPMCLWEYDGGSHLFDLQRSDTWRRVARRVPHGGFPKEVRQLTFRLYAVGRTTISMEIQSVRFRAMSAVEAEASREAETALDASAAPAAAPEFEAVFPMGVYMNARTGRQMAELMHVPFDDYWRLAVEDVVRHHHNCIALEEVESCSSAEFKRLLDLAAAHQVRILALRDWPIENIEADGKQFIAQNVLPYADKEALLAWGFTTPPSGRWVKGLLALRDQLDSMDPRHPLTVLMQEPNGYPYFAPHFAASGVSHYKSHLSHSIGAAARTHRMLSQGRRFWVSTPAFTQATGYPGWNTSPETRLMLNQAIANGTLGWFSYTYHNTPAWVSGSYQRSLTGPFLTFSDLWSELGHRMERFAAMAPLFLNAAPVSEPEYDFHVDYKVNPRSQRSEEIPPLEMFWFRGPDFALLYIISNDTTEMTPVNLRVPDSLPKGLEVYDLTDFARSRHWAPMEKQRHLEMFPGQGQIIFLAEQQAAQYWRDQVIAHTKMDDQRQVALDITLAQRHDLEISDVQRLVQQVGRGDPLEDLARMRQARDELVNIFYAAKPVAETRSELIKASAAICGCDGSLCRLLKADKIELARDLGKRVLPLAREMTTLRLRLRRGHAPDIHEDCVALSKKALEVLEHIRSRT